MLTRENFEQQREATRRVAKREGRISAAFSVPLGVAQLIFLRWAEGHLPRGPRLAIAGCAFLVYLGVVLILVSRMNRRLQAVRPRCSQCGIALKDVAERVTAQTGRCEACGSRVFDESGHAGGQPS